ncbi:hypothetical protein AWW72_14120 [Acinetobacter sp. NRRL B-65365]|uniref:hypothetical protein n=1 Tax=Acinetobacter sp. NRRL B-65365 TaxID=1785092 RepID=UPI00079FFB02|nr:hypothetical protein [Acinetobacter sp. NRRL B-65365]KYQ83477.1 hypothetical protein AWW72_14120 [Acinetobacter sp. NRRL B-65365]
MITAQQNERIDARVLVVLRNDALSRVAIAKKTGINLEDVKLSIHRLKRQGYVEVRGSTCFLTELPEDVCFGG